MQAMAFVTKERALAKTPLTSNERNLLSIAFKHVVGARRSSWRAMASIESKYEEAKEYKERIEKELNDICNQVIVSFGRHVRTINLLIVCVFTGTPDSDHRECNRK